jgi:hypothetical protein
MLALANHIEMAFQFHRIVLVRFLQIYRAVHLEEDSPVDSQNALLRVPGKKGDCRLRVVYQKHQFLLEGEFCVLNLLDLTF